LPVRETTGRTAGLPFAGGQSLRGWTSMATLAARTFLHARAALVSSCRRR
jgi:hypothetical protein